MFVAIQDGVFFDNVRGTNPGGLVDMVDELKRATWKLAPEAEQRKAEGNRVRATHLVIQPAQLNDIYNRLLLRKTTGPLFLATRLRSRRRRDPPCSTPTVPTPISS